ncbi:unnamed protein product [Ectocarpus sp. 13 AM-2016]
MYQRYLLCLIFVCVDMATRPHVQAKYDPHKQRVPLGIHFVSLSRFDGGRGHEHETTTQAPKLSCPHRPRPPLSALETQAGESPSPLSGGSDAGIGGGGFSPLSLSLSLSDSGGAGGEPGKRYGDGRRGGHGLSEYVGGVERGRRGGGVGNDDNEGGGAVISMTSTPRVGRAGLRDLRKLRRGGARRGRVSLRPRQRRRSPRSNEWRKSWPGQDLPLPSRLRRPLAAVATATEAAAKTGLGRAEKERGLSATSPSLCEICSRPGNWT